MKTLKKTAIGQGDDQKNCLPARLELFQKAL